MWPIRMTSMSTTEPSTAISSASVESSGEPIPNSMQSRHFMASDIDSAKNDDADLVLTWTGRWTLAHRILAVNVLTLALVLLAIFYLDSYRNRLEKERIHKAEAEAEMAATALQSVPQSGRAGLLANLSRQNKTRIRVYGQ